jgi:folate-binding protein YgfZ
MPGLLGLREDVTVLQLQGDDVRRFANGQFTNNVRDLPVGAHQHTALTDDRGRLLALADLVLQAEDRVLLVLEGLDEEGFSEAFRIPILLDDIAVTRLDGPIHTVQADAAVREALSAIDLPSWPAPRSPTGGIDVLGPVPDDWQAALRDASPEELEALRIEVGWARFPVDASDKQLPHELGLRDTHLHFEKGCYRGQEIIHRVDVMGQVRKQLTGLVLTEPVEPGAVLKSEAGKKVGRMGSSALHPDLGRIGLAVVRNEQREPGTVLSVDGSDATATVRAFSGT